MESSINVFKVKSACRTANEDYVVMLGYNNDVCIGTTGRYNFKGIYYNMDNSLFYLCNDKEYPKVFNFLSGKGYVISKEKLKAKYSIPQKDFDKYDEIIKSLKEKDIDIPNVFAIPKEQKKQREVR